MKKWSLAVLAAALLVASVVNYGCSGSGRWTITTATDGQGVVQIATTSGNITNLGIVGCLDGEGVTVTAMPTPFWRFDSWSGDYSGTDNPFIFEIERNMTFVARFIPNTKSDKLINETIAMAPAEPGNYGHNAYSAYFAVGAVGMHDVTVSGTFNVTSTSPGDQVEVLILDDANYSALMAAGTWTPLYSSGQVTSGAPNVPITTANQGATPFYLVFVGISPSGPSVTVQANVDLKYTAYS